MSKRKTTKQLLKTEIDRADQWIVLANLGERAGAKKPENLEKTAEERKFVISKLMETKKNMAEYFETYNKQIEEAISKMQ